MKLAWMLAASALLCPIATWAQVIVTPLQEFAFQTPALGFDQAKLAFDQQYMYVASPEGKLFRVSAADPTGPLQQILEGAPVNALIPSGHALYVLNYTEPVPENETLVHSILKSPDHGDTFTPVDAGLHYCLSGDCLYLWATDLTTDGSHLYTNAGGGRNLLASSDEGNTWKALAGTLDFNVCTNSAFEITGRTVVQGGECPLDDAFLSRGYLAPNMVDWAPGEDLKPVQSPDLGNRNVITIKAMPHLPVIFAGIEGAILRSVDNGYSFSFVYYQPISNDEEFYPYIQHIVFPSQMPTAVVAAGFNKAIGTPFLAYSPLFGQQWIDLSSFLPGARDNAEVTDLAEDPQGRIVVVITDTTKNTVTVARLQFSIGHV